MLRQRDNDIMETWGGFLHFFLSGLSKLPKVNSVKTYRGVPIESEEQLKTFETSYTGQRRVHWTGFTSTSRDIERAKKFAKNEGVIFVIKVCNGLSVENYSFFRQEKEVILRANSAFVVTKTLHKKDGFYWVKLIQESSDPTQVDFKEVLPGTAPRDYKS